MMGGGVGHWLFHVGAGRGSLIANRDSRSRSRDHPRAKSVPRIRAGVIRIEGSSSCAYVSGNRIGIHMVLVLRRKGAPLRSAFGAATSRHTVKKTSLKRGLQPMSGVRVQLPKNSHSRSITGIGTPISQSKSPFPIRRLLECHIR